MNRKKKRSIGIVLPLLLIVSVAMLLVYVLLILLDKQLNRERALAEPVNHPAESKSLTPEVTTAPILRDVTYYSDLMQELLAEYGEPRIAKNGDAIGIIGTVYNPEMYFLDGIYARLVDLDSDGIHEMYCAAVDHQNDTIFTALYGYSEGKVKVLSDRLPVMYLPEDSEQTVLMRSTTNNAYYLVNEQYNPNGDPVVLRKIYQKSGFALNEVGKYISGDAKDASKYEAYIHVEGLSAIPLSLIDDSRTRGSHTSIIFPAVGQSKWDIEQYATESAETISRILK
ncbi:MAG TPA: hypothetical protein DCG49_13190 [Ruminococcus sp.]|nr:hypothetical protein [Ruminococcus sp.]